MFEGEKNGPIQERGSLLSLSRGTKEAMRDRAEPSSASVYADDAQSRHRLARARREASAAAAPGPLAMPVDDGDAVAVLRGRNSSADDAQRMRTAAPEQPSTPAVLSKAAKEPGAAERLRNFLRGRITSSAENSPGSEAAKDSPAGLTAEPEAFERRDAADDGLGGGRRAAGASFGDDAWTPLIDPLRVIGRVFDSKLLIVSTTVLGAMIGVAIALSTPKKYEAITELLVDPRELKLSERDLTEQGLPSDATLAIVENQTRILTSGTVLAAVVRDLNLASDPEFNGTRKSFGVGAFIAELRAILSRSGDDRAGDEKREMIAVETLGRALSVERGGKTFVITVGVSTESPEKSALIANTMKDVYLETYGQIQSQTAGRAADELANRLDELRKGVEAAERKVADFKAENDIVDPQGRLITDDEIIKLNDQLSTARARTLELSARAASVRDVDVDAVLAGAMPEGINSNIITELRSQYAALKSESERTSVRLGPRHPERQAVEAQLAGARDQIATELRRIASSIQVEMKRAVELEQQLAQRLAQLKVRQGDLSGELVQLRELEREASTKRAVYEAYLLRARETGEQRDINTANISVISKAYPPLDPTGPSRSMIALTGAFLGFASGVGFAMMQGAYESLRDRRRNAQRRRPLPTVPAPDGSGPGSRMRGATPGSSDRASDQPAERREHAFLAQDAGAFDQARSLHAQEPDTSSQEDSSMLRHPADPYYQPGPEPSYAANGTGWQPQPMPVHPAQAYPEFAPVYDPYAPQPQVYPAPGAHYAAPAPLHVHPGYAQHPSPYPPAHMQPPAAYAPPSAAYPYPPRQDPRLPPGHAYGAEPASYPVQAATQAPAQAMPSYPPAEQRQPQSYPPQATAGPASQPIPFPGRHIRAADAPEPVSQTLTEQDTARAIADIRASLAEFREAVRDFTESRQRRRFF